MKNPSGDVWTFDDFEPGSELGRLSLCLDESRLHNWSSIYGSPQSSENVPSGMLVAAMMEAYLKAFQPRPPGNIHVNQKLTFSGRPVKVGTQVDIVVSCLSKELRKERRWVNFGVAMRDGQEDVLRGESLIIWAR
jgi:acyl dehydratase